ncbi:BP74-related protein [Neotamlana sedimentorum]|uniref:BP74-related protein n=1 Tax=Neotamlana sedimentorum TaxID=1435349 RepID=UPI000A810E63|nr:hypothetical protein [Tamlana sedimentorum]
MKKILIRFNVLIFTSFMMLTSCSNDDNKTTPELSKRYFRFQSCPESNHGNWQDTSFVAATSDPKVIQKCLEQLNLPIESRLLFPLGKIESGNQGYNKNGAHLFNWHFIEDSWEMVELGIEIYDGCPYSDVELTNYVDNLGSYGGWSNRVVEEIEEL